MARRLVVNVQLPDRSADDTFTKQRLHYDDIKDTMLLVQKRLTDAAMSSGVTGWDMDQNSIEYHIHRGVITGTVLLTRPSDD